MTSRETTSGITVMRMALTHRVPTGPRASAARIHPALPEAAMAVPASRPATSASRTRVPSFIAISYIIRSPPLMSSAAPVT